MAELNQLYVAAAPDAALAALPPVTCTPRQHALAKQAAAASAAGVAARRAEDAFWAARLRPVEEGGLPPAPQLPLLAPAGGGGGGLSRLSHRLSAAQWRALRAQCQRHALTPTAALLAAYAAVLATWSSRHFTLTLASFGRGAGAEAVVGQLADVMLVEVDLREAQPFSEAARALGRETNPNPNPNPNPDPNPITLTLTLTLSP